MRITHKQELTEDEKREVERGSQFYQEFKMGLFMPEFNNNYAEAQVSIYYDKDVRDVRTHLQKYETELINNPCEPDLQMPDEASLDKASLDEASLDEASSELSGHSQCDTIAVFVVLAAAIFA